MISKIKIVKLIHTSIWAVMASASFYILYSAIAKTYGPLLWISIFLLVAETLVLLFNKWTCPLTPIAKKYTNDRNDNFDIYLPNWLARYNKIIFGTIFVVSLFLLIVDFIAGL